MMRRLGRCWCLGGGLIVDVVCLFVQYGSRELHLLQMRVSCDITDNFLRYQEISRD
jgi:hypothetical protein